SLEAVNSGSKFLNSCRMNVEGSVSEWISNKQVESISPGQKATFIFGLNVPQDAEQRKYHPDIRIICDELNATTSFIIDVFSTDFGFNVLSSVRDGSKLIVNYVLEDYTGEAQEVSIGYSLNNLDGASV